MFICTFLIFTFFETSIVLAKNGVSLVTFKNITLVIHTNLIIMPEVALVTISTVAILIISADFVSHYSEIIIQEELRKYDVILSTTQTEDESTTQTEDDHNSN